MSFAGTTQAAQYSLSFAFVNLYILFYLLRYVFYHPASGTYAEELAATPKSAGWFKFLAWEGGTIFDAFFTCASAQVSKKTFIVDCCAHK